MDGPIIFSAPMVRAIKRGDKTQTRRLLYSPRKFKGDVPPASVRMLEGHPLPRIQIGLNQAWGLTGWHARKPGDRLYVRENIKLISQGPNLGQVGITYEADGDMPEIQFFTLPGHKLKRIGVTPCIHMPRAISRMTLTLTEVRTEHLQDMSEEDAKAEGMHHFMTTITGGNIWGFDPQGTPGDLTGSTAKEAFAHLWEELHHPGPSSWGYNPEVVVLTFTIAEQNIDQQEKKNAAA
jgi:hypothetical protein